MWMVYAVRDRRYAWWILHDDGYGLARQDDTVAILRKRTERAIFAMQGRLRVRTAWFGYKEVADMRTSRRTLHCCRGLPSFSVVVP